MPEHFVMTGIGGVWNYGCEAIVRATLQMLQEAFPGHSLDLVAGAGSDRTALADAAIRTIKKRGRYSLPRIARKALRTLHLPWQHILDVSMSWFRDATCVLSIGGDIYTPHVSGLPWGLLRTEERILRLGKPLVLWGASVGPFKEGSEEQHRMQSYLQQLRLITARETLTVEYLASIGIKEKVVLVADPAFLLRPEQFPCEAWIPRTRGDALVALNLSPLLGMYLERCDGRTIMQVGVDCVSHLLKELPVSVVLVPHVMGRPIDNDHQLLARIAGALSDTSGRVSLLPAGLGARKTKYFISQCDVVVAARMHCAIGALSSLVPTACISYSMKSRGVLGDLYDSDRWILPLEELTGPALTERVRGLLDERDSVHDQLALAMLAIQKKASKAVSALKQCLG